MDNNKNNANGKGRKAPARTNSRNVNRVPNGIPNTNVNRVPNGIPNTNVNRVPNGIPNTNVNRVLNGTPDRNINRAPNKNINGTVATGRYAIKNQEKGFYGKAPANNKLGETVQYSIKGKNKLKSNVAPKQNVTPGIRENNKYNNLYGRGNGVNESGKNNAINNSRMNNNAVPNNMRMNYNMDVNNTENKNTPQYTKHSLTSIIMTDNNGKKKTHNQEMTKIVVSVMLIFLGLIGYMTYFLMVSSKDIVSRQENKHSSVYEKTVKKGSIYDRNGNILAKTAEDANGEEYREYPYKGLFAQLVGIAHSKYKSGFEEKYEYVMLNSSQNYKDKLVNELKGVKSNGDNLVLTVDADVQNAANNAMKNYSKGAIIALDPTTGEVITMLSKPTFDPNTLMENWDEVNELDSPFVNRTVNGAYPPGSTFKIVTTLEYLIENDNNTSDYSYDCNGEIEYNNGEYTLHCFNNKSHGKEDLKTSFANSCNTSFANIGTLLDTSKFSKLCDKLLIGKELPYNYGLAYSGSFSLSDDTGDSYRAQTVIGQGDTLISPMHNALITAAIANGGTLVEPLLIKKVESTSGKVVEENTAKNYGELMSSEQASILSEYMSAVVSSGTAKGKFTSDLYKVAGKTGSAENDTGKAHAWFVGYATNDAGKKLVVCVLIENGGTGGSAAVPVAKNVFDMYFNKY